MKWMKLAGGIVVLGAAVALGVPLTTPFWFAPKQTAEVVLSDPALIARGRYLARVADCVACHTAPGGKEFAGGLAMSTPIGQVFSTNITPDPVHGIGAYDYGDFERAVRQGVRRDGASLYPAMPFVSYAVVSDDDIKALYAYFRSAVAPVAEANRPSTIPWPLSMRWPLAWWQLAFGGHRAFVPPAGANQTGASQAGASQEVTRGAYLVEGLGHCGACHTPRGVGMQERALRDAPDGLYLSGGTLEGWYAQNLRGEAAGLAGWSAGEIALFLKTGRTDRTAAFGSMTGVVEHSTQYLTDADAQAIGAYLKTLAPRPGHPARAAAAAPADTTERLVSGDDSSPGALAYVQNCATCHRLDGAGMPRIFPALAGNRMVSAPDASSLIQVTLAGSRMAQTPADRMTFEMPGFDQLDNKTLAATLTFVRAAWGNRAAPVTPAEVGAMRAQIGLKPSADAPPAPGLPLIKEGKPVGIYHVPTDDEIAALPDATDILYGKRLLDDTLRLLPQNAGAQMNCNSCHLSGGRAPGSAPYLNTARIFPGYNPRAGRQITIEDRINGCFLRSMNGKPLENNSPEMKAMVAYMEWLAAKVPAGEKVKVAMSAPIDKKLIPDANRGAQIYADQCASCHGANGEGLRNAAGEMVFPPLWGDESFNIGAGMARLFTAAAFVKANMPFSVNATKPLGQGHALTDQEALDVSLYFTRMPRPDFAPKVNDWPKGGKPPDSRY